MNTIFNIASNIATPLALGGFFAAIFFFLIKQIIEKNIFPTLTKALSSDIIKLIIHYVFFLSLIAMILGFIGYIIPIYLVNAEKSEADCKKKLYKLGSGPACGVASYISKASEHCGVVEYKSGSGEVCGVAQYKECETGGCGWTKLGGVLDIGKVKANTCRHPNCCVESYKTCKDEVFGVAYFKTCEHEAHGVKEYKSCRSPDFGFEKCEDPKLWEFWK